MDLHHDALERRASVRTSVRNQLKRIGHSIEFHPEERIGLVSGHFIASSLEMQVTNLNVNLTSSCMVRMMIAS